MNTVFSQFCKPLSHQARFKNLETIYLQQRFSFIHSHVFLFFKKILCIVLIIQLAYPQSALMAMDNEELIFSFSLPQRATTSEKLPLTEKLKVLYNAQNMIPKLIDDESVPEQTIEDYYVNLQILLDEKTTGEKKPIPLNQLFEKVEGKETDGKVLIVGTPGIGKSTLLHHISYEWSKNRVFTERFDSVFTVKLKKLTTDAWGAKSTRIKNPLETLIDESLGDQLAELERKGIAIEEIAEEEVIAHLKDEVQRDRTLLLLDGYDEMAHLANKIDHIAYRIMNEIFKYPNVVVTSRPNVLTSQMMDKFTRIIESTGLSSEGVRTYIDQYFDSQAKGTNSIAQYYYKDCKDSLLDLVQRNPTVATVLTVPLNAVMMCLISTDSDLRRAFAGDFSIGQLYQNVTVWLGKRYAHKFQGKDTTQFVADRVFEMDEVKTLEHMAYETFKENQLSMRGERIDTLARTIHKDLTLSDIIKYGLLNVENTNGSVDPLKQDHKFIHLSFQEYMLAHYLKTRLLKGTELEVQETAQFIGGHRNEPKYLLTLKLMAGLVSAEQDVATNNSSLSTTFPIVTRFWDAVTCNVDGVLEFGLETKISLLMHLLAQGKRNEKFLTQEESEWKFDSRNPHLPTLTTLIDEIVLKNIANWGEHIIQSGYLSEAITNHLNAVFREAQEAKAQELKTSMEVISNLARRSEFGGRENIFKQLLQIIKQTENWQIKKLGLQKLEQIMDRSISEVFLQDCLAAIVPLLEDENFSNDVSDLFPNIIKAAPELMGEVFDLLSPLLKDSEYERRNVRKIAAKSLGKVVKTVFELSPQVFSLFELLLTDPRQEIRPGAALSLGEMVQVAPFMAPQVVSLLAPLLKDLDNDTRRSAVLYLGKIVKTAPELAPQVFSLLTPLLKDSWAIVRQVAALRLREVAQASPTQALPFLTPLLKDFDKSIREAAARSLGTIIKAAPSVSPQLFSLLGSLLKDPNGYCRESAALSLGEVVQTTPFVASQAILLLEPLLKDADWNVRDAATKSLEMIVKTVPAIALRAVSLLEPLMKDPNKYVRSAAARRLRAIVETEPILASQVILLFIPLLKDPDKDVKSSTALHLGRVVRSDPTVASQVFSLLEPLLEDPERSVRAEAAKSLGAVVQVAPSTLVYQVVSLLEPLLLDSEWPVRAAAAESLGEIQAAPTTLISHVLSLLKPLLLDPEWAVKGHATKSLTEITRAVPAMALQIFPLLEPLLKDTNVYVKRELARSLGEVARAAPEVTSEVVSLLEPLLKDFDTYVKLAAAESLREIALVVPAITLDILNLLGSHDIFSGDDRAKKLFFGFPLTTLTYFLNQQWLKADARGAFETALLSRLKSTPIESLSNEDIIPLLVVTDLTKNINDTKDINFAAQKALKQMAREVDDAGVAWINAHFDELPALPERQAFLKAVYHTLLKREHINEIGCNFIINCIESGLTTTITRSGTIIHEGVPYMLSAESKPYLNAITEAALQQNDRLAELYRCYQPLFPNNRIGLRIAASDIAPVSSLAGSYSLSGGCWRLTLLTSDKSSSPFILLEKRNRFGDRVVQKFDAQGKSLTQRYVLHPDDTMRAFRENLFGTRILSTYEAQSILLSEDKKRELFFEGFLGDTSIIDPQLGISETWDNFKTRLFTQTAKRYSLTHVDLLGIDPTSEEGLLMQQEKALQDSGVYDLAAIRSGFKHLEHLSPHLKSYCKTFYWTMANFFEAYRSLSTGLFKGNITAEISTKEKVGVQIAKKGAQYATEALKSIPFVGGAIGLLDALIDDIIITIEQNRFNNKINAIMTILQEKFSTTHDMSNTIAAVALAMTHEREESILHPPHEVMDNSVIGKVNHLKSNFEKKLSDLKNAILPSIKLNDPENPAVQLALRDVALIMAYLFKNNEEIIKNKDSLDVQMIEIIRNGGLEELLSTSPSQPTSASSQSTSHTAVNNNSTKEDSVSALHSKSKNNCVLM
jgi:HEAT repeat protein